MVPDVIVVAVALAAGVALPYGRHSFLRPYDGLTVIALALVALSLCWRRRAPLIVAWIVAGTAIALPVTELLAPDTLVRTDDPVVLASLICWPPAAPFAAYAATAFARGPRLSWLPVGVMLASPGLLLWVLPGGWEQSAPQSGTGSAIALRSVALVALATLLGLYAATRRRLLSVLAERAQRAERESHLLARQARAEERSRMAAELHDAVTWRLRLMIKQAGELAAVASDQSIRAAGEELCVAGRQALLELQAVIGLLRRPDSPGLASAPAESAPVPRLDTLIAESAALGIPVDFAESGNPPLVSPAVGRTVYRIVQESLTNVRKHAAGARVAVEVRYGADSLRLSVTNTAPTEPGDRALAGTGSGTGLLGLRQRVDVIGGTFSAGPAEGGGFRIESTLPAFVRTASRGSLGQDRDNRSARE